MRTPIDSRKRALQVTMTAALLLATAAGGTPLLQARTPTLTPGAAAAPVVFVGTVRDIASGGTLSGVQVRLKERGALATTDAAGRYVLRTTELAAGTRVTLTAERSGYAAASRTLAVGGDTMRVDFGLAVARPAAVAAADAQKVAPLNAPPMSRAMGVVAAPTPMFARKSVAAEREPRRERRRDAMDSSIGGLPRGNREAYDRIEDNPFLAVSGNPRSTFSIDVDRASYGNVRRMLNEGNAPPADAVRIEELVNYFPYTLAAPTGNAPVAITTETAPAPWQPRHRLVRIALKAREIETAQLPASNLVFLIDVSGSMMSPDKLPLVKSSLRLLVDNLREQDHVAIVAYAGAAGLVLPSTSGSEKARLAEAIDRLEAGGSTAGGAGLELAYRVARENFKQQGNNRVILATDGDFNVGPSSDGEMERLIEIKRTEGTYLTVLGFGTGNLQDAKMEKLAKKGNGNYAYVDDIAEARKTLVHEMGATLVTVANDVKLQVEFNPAAVSAYRLIGYEDRLLRDEDFIDDRKDAGDMGAGHTVTALYEVVPTGVTGTVDARGADALRYTAPAAEPTRGNAGELLYVKLRYKRPGEATSQLLTQVVKTADIRNSASNDFRFAASVASFGMLLRGSEHKGNASATSVLAMARGALGTDEGGYRAEFVRLVERWQSISKGMAAR